MTAIASHRGIPGIAGYAIRRAAGALLALALTLAGAAHAGDTRVITFNGASPTRLDTRFLRLVFTMRLRTWPDGTPIRVFVLPDRDPLHDDFCRQWLHAYPYVLRNQWNQLVFTGTGFAPDTVGSVKEMLERVSSTPGAIGYVDHLADVRQTQVNVVPLSGGTSE